MSETFYRHELVFDGELQDVGFLNGLMDVGLPINIENKLYEPFEMLESPIIHPDGKKIEFWFTEAGNEQFADAIHAIAEAIQPYGWDLKIREKTVSSELGNSIYRDEFQVAWFITT